ncbi:MAG: hypothetical protein L6427_01670 [Actinomycetia bacterium]|nr:hypothetical protein [Actinomycetes bacterium]
MGRNPAPRKRAIRAVSTIALLVFLAVPLVASGCGSQTPEGVVRDFYKAIEDGDWNAYLSSVLAENVRRMTEEDVQYEKERLLEGDFTYEGLKFETVYDEKKENEAEVELIEGKITGTNPTSGERETTTVAEIKKQYDITPSFKTRKYKGRWYVDVPLASVDMPEPEY